MKHLLIILLFLLSALHAQDLTIGSKIQTLNSFDFETPKSRKMKIPLNTKIVLIAFDKDTGALVNEYLNTQNKYFLQRRKAIFIADINKMPTVITNMFALPKLREYKHLIYLHYSDKLESFVPKKDEKVSVLKFEDQQLKEITYISTKAELAKVF